MVLPDEKEEFFIPKPDISNLPPPEVVSNLSVDFYIDGVYNNSISYSLKQVTGYPDFDFKLYPVCQALTGSAGAGTASSTSSIDLSVFQYPIAGYSAWEDGNGNPYVWTEPSVQRASFDYSHYSDKPLSLNENTSIKAMFEVDFGNFGFAGGGLIISSIVGKEYFITKSGYNARPINYGVIKSNTLGNFIKFDNLIPVNNSITGQVLGVCVNINQ